MRRAAKFSALFLCLTVATLGLKIKTGEVATEIDAARFEHDLAVILRFASFEVVKIPSKISGSILMATRDRCSIQLRDATGWFGIEQAYAERAEKIGPVQYAYDGRYYEKTPYALSQSIEFLMRFKRRLGGSAPIKPVVAVAQTSGCDFSATSLMHLRKYYR
jgi:hypothetical protein